MPKIIELWYMSDVKDFLFFIPRGEDFGIIERIIIDKIIKMPNGRSIFSPDCGILGYGLYNSIKANDENFLYDRFEVDGDTIKSIGLENGSRVVVCTVFVFRSKGRISYQYMTDNYQCNDDDYVKRQLMTYVSPFHRNTEMELTDDFILAHQYKVIAHYDGYDFAVKAVEEC